jgi:hypothetical protein
MKKGGDLHEIKINETRPAVRPRNRDWSGAHMATSVPALKRVGVEGGKESRVKDDPWQCSSRSREFLSRQGEFG